MSHMSWPMCYLCLLVLVCIARSSKQIPWGTSCHFLYQRRLVKTRRHHPQTFVFERVSSVLVSKFELMALYNSIGRTRCNNASTAECRKQCHSGYQSPGPAREPWKAVATFSRPGLRTLSRVCTSVRSFMLGILQVILA